MIRYFSCFFVFLLLFSSCEKNISIQLDPSSTDLVVDASIENGRYPVVILSNSLAYFSKIDQQILAASFVHHAHISIRNGQVTSQLKEDSVLVDSSGYWLYYYTVNPADTALKFTGEFNKQYDLTILTGNKTYAATTTIPSLAKVIDSLWWIPAPEIQDSDKAVLKALITDPPGFGNYIRYYTSVNGGPYYPGLNSVFDDQVTDGTIFSITVPQGVNRNARIDLNDYNFFKKGETVVVKYTNIDKATYDFWRTMEYNYQSVGNPFSTPTRVISNISNGALGNFGGYAAQYKQLVIPK